MQFTVKNLCFPSDVYEQLKHEVHPVLHTFDEIYSNTNKRSSLIVDIKSATNRQKAEVLTLLAYDKGSLYKFPILVELVLYLIRGVLVLFGTKRAKETQAIRAMNSVSEVAEKISKLLDSDIGAICSVVKKYSYDKEEYFRMLTAFWMCGILKDA